MQTPTSDPTPRIKLLQNLKAICSQMRQRGDVATARAALDEEEELSRRIEELEQLLPSVANPEKEAA